MSETATLSDRTAHRAGGAGVFARLAAMMFLQFFVWGAWYVTMSAFMTDLNMTGDIGIAYMLMPIAAIVSPFFLGMVADRYFASERVLAVMHLLGGAAMFLVPQAAQSGVGAFLAVILLHALFYMPTINLTNSIAFANLTDQEKQFPMIRVFGTVGWIVAGLVISGIKADRTATQFQVAGGAAILLGVFSLMLPHTPPPAKGKRASVGDIFGVRAFSLFRSRSFTVFAVSSFLICIPLAAYYNYAGRMVGDMGKPIGSTMAIGQGAEVLFMLALPFAFARLGVKWMLVIGMLAWAARYALFSAGAPGNVFWMIAIGIALHGICYDFFFVTGFIYTDKRATADIRNQAQGLIVLITYGLGLAVGAYVAGLLFNGIVGTAKGADALPLYRQFWLYPAGFAVAVMVFFAALFRDDSKDAPVGPGGDDAARGFEPVAAAGADSNTAQAGAPR